MNNNDLFQIEVDGGRHLAAAKLALDFAAGKSSKSGAWAWASSAIEEAAKAGITLDAGHLSWPDLDGMRKQLE